MFDKDPNQVPVSPIGLTSAKSQFIGKSLRANAALNRVVVPSFCVVARACVELDHCETPKSQSSRVVTASAHLLVPPSLTMESWSLGHEVRHCCERQQLSGRVDILCVTKPNRGLENQRGLSGNLISGKSSTLGIVSQIKTSSVVGCDTCACVFAQQQRRSYEVPVPSQAWSITDLSSTTEPQPRHANDAPSQLGDSGGPPCRRPATTSRWTTPFDSGCIQLGRPSS